MTSQNQNEEHWLGVRMFVDVHGWVHPWMDWWMDRLMDGWRDEWINKKMFNLMHWSADYWKNVRWIKKQSVPSLKRILLSEELHTYHIPAVTQSYKHGVGWWTNQSPFHETNNTTNKAITSNQNNVTGQNTSSQHNQQSSRQTSATNRLFNDWFCAKAAASRDAPSSPISFPERTRFSNDSLLRTAFANSIAPSSPIRLSAKPRDFNTLLYWRASASCPAPASATSFPPKPIDSSLQRVPLRVRASSCVSTSLSSVSVTDPLRRKARCLMPLSVMLFPPNASQLKRESSQFARKASQMAFSPMSPMWLQPSYNRMKKHWNNEQPAWMVKNAKMQKKKWSTSSTIASVYWYTDQRSHEDVKLRRRTSDGCGWSNACTCMSTCALAICMVGR